MAIPKEQYLGIYFKKNDKDLIAWKEHEEDNYTQYVKDAIREKITRDKEEAQREHPVVILNRLESQQLKIGVLIQKILSLLSGNGENRGHIDSLNDAEEIKHYQESLLYNEENTLDQGCSDAGWE